jgi:hypothetical protein
MMRVEIASLSRYLNRHTGRCQRGCWRNFLHGGGSTLNPCAKGRSVDDSERFSGIGTPVAPRGVARSAPPCFVKKRARTEPPGTPPPSLSP